MYRYWVRIYRGEGQLGPDVGVHTLDAALAAIIEVVNAGDFDRVVLFEAEYRTEFTYTNPRRPGA